MGGIFLPSVDLWYNEINSKLERSFHMAIESSIIFLPCINLEETTKFYTEVIGLTVAKDLGSTRLIDTGYGYWGFCQYDDGRPLASSICLSHNCADNADVDAYYQRITSHGVETMGAPRLHPVFPVYSFFIHDPNGYLVEFQKIQK